MQGQATQYCMMFVVLLTFNLCECWVQKLVIDLVSGCEWCEELVPAEAFAWLCFVTNHERSRCRFWALNLAHSLHWCPLSHDLVHWA